MTVLLLLLLRWRRREANDVEVEVAVDGALVGRCRCGSRSSWMDHVADLLASLQVQLEWLTTTEDASRAVAQCVRQARAAAAGAPDVAVRLHGAMVVALAASPRRLDLALYVALVRELSMVSYMQQALMTMPAVRALELGRELLEADASLLPPVREVLAPLLERRAGSSSSSAATTTYSTVASVLASDAEWSSELLVYVAARPAHICRGAVAEARALCAVLLLQPRRSTAAQRRRARTLGALPSDRSLSRSAGSCQPLLARGSRRA